MTGSSPVPADSSARGAARLAGVAYAVIFVLAVYANFAVRMRLVDVDDAAATARNLAGSAGSVRLAVAAFTVVFLLDIAVAWALYVLFRPAGARRALHAAWFRLAYTVFLGVACVFLVMALRLATADTYRGGLGPSGADAAALLALEAFDVAWLVGLAAFGVHLVLVGRILRISRLGPALLGWTLTVAGVAYVADTFAHLLLADYQAVAPAFLVLVAVPSVVGELWFTIWLLARAGRTPSAPSATTTSGGAAVPAR